MFCLNNLTRFHLDRLWAYSPPLACYDHTASTFIKTVTAFMQVTLKRGWRGGISSTHSGEGTNMIIKKFSLKKGKHLIPTFAEEPNPSPSQLLTCRCFCMCLYMPIYIHAHKYICIHRHVHTYICAQSSFETTGQIILFL